MVCNDISDLALLLDMKPNRLSFILYQIPEAAKYKQFEIPKKSGGIRTITAPSKTIRSLQRRMLAILETHYKQRPCSHGFEIGKNTISNAKMHTKRTVVLNLDLENFFGSINFGRVYGLLRAKPFEFGKSAAAAAANLLCYNKSLPQGAPTSPIITNMLCKRLDARITQLSAKSSARYTRYVDDITISTQKDEMDSGLVIVNNSGSIEIGKQLREIVESEGFKINEKKVRIQSHWVRQEVTGITVNQFPNLQREYINNLFAMINSWKTKGIEIASKDYEEKYRNKLARIHGEELFRSVIIGRIGYVATVRGWHDPIVWKLCRRYCAADSNPPSKIGAIGNMSAKNGVFIGHASEDKDSVAFPIYRSLQTIGVPAFIDAVKITWGTSITKVINQALKESTIFLAIISKSSIIKTWPDKEIQSVLSQEIGGKGKLILPLFVGTKEEINELRSHYPLIFDKLYKEWDGNPDALANDIKGILESLTA